MTAAPNPRLRASSLVPAWAPMIYGLAFVWVVASAGGRAQNRAQVALTIGLLAVGAILIVLAWLQRHAEVGAEGIRLRWLFFRRLIRYADVRRAAPGRKGGILITTTKGESIDLHARTLDEAVARAVVERLWRSISAGNEEGARGTERETLARSGRTTAKWRSALRELGAPAGYRHTSFSRDRLVAIAENPGIAAEVRVAAVVALTAAELDAGTRERLRTAGDVAVDPDVRALLERVSAPGAALSEHACDTVLDGVAPSPKS